MTELYMVLGLFTILVLVLLWWAIKARPESENIEKDANPEVFRQRLSELQQDLADGSLDAESFHQLETELQRQLLAETEVGAGAVAAQHSLGAVSAALVLLAVGLLSVLLYRQFGAWPEMQFNQVQQSLAGKRNFTPDDMKVLDGAIQSTLKYRPDNPELRFWHAQLAVEQGDYSEAVKSYRLLLEQESDNPTLMAQLAQALFLDNNRVLTAEARNLLQSAIAVDPGQTTALGMLGMDAFEREDYRAAVQHWSALVNRLDPQVPQAMIVRDALKRAKRLAVANQTLEGIRVVVKVGEGITLPEQGMLYVFAKAAAGPPLPLAVVREPQHQSSWPQTFMLTPQDAMRPQMTLNQFDEVRVSARFSTSGSVASVPGDVEGVSGVLRWKELSQPVELVLDHVVPEPSADASKAAEQTVEGIKVVVSVGEGISLPDQGVLYVFAKAAEGPAFPLAVVREPQSRQQSNWPQTFMLTPKDSMRPDMTLNQFDEVRVSVRYSQSGSVTPSSGDVQGASGILRWKELASPVELVLDQVIP